MAAPPPPLQTAASSRAQRRQDVAGVFKNAMACYQRGLVGEAQKGFRLVLKKHPHHFETWHMLGLCEHQLGDSEAAVRAIKRALLVDPQSASAHSNLGTILLSMGRAEESLVSCDTAIRLAPTSTDAHYNRGNALFALGRFTDAAASFRTASALNPRSTDAFNNCGNALHKARQFLEAIACYDNVLTLDPGHVLAYINRGAALVELRKTDAAIADFDRALALAPDHAGAWINRGEALLLRRLLPEALQSYDAAIKLDPRSPEAWLGRANVLVLSRRVDDAKQACQQALAIAPNSVKALVQFGQCLAHQGDAEAAIALFDRALQIDPRNEAAHANRIFTLDFSASASFADHQAARADWWRAIGAVEVRGRPAPVHNNERNPLRKLVVGYVGAEFKRCSAAYTYRSLLENHDKAQFEIVCYSATTKSDEVTESFKQAADHWREVAQWSDDQLEDCVKRDKIDILVDLFGHSADNRLRVFARKPAPVQVTAWGHATGTGMPTMDYLFSDPIAIPHEVRHRFAEQVYDLPCLIVAEPPRGEFRSPVAPMTQNGFLTYGVFNRISKLSDAAVALWSRLLESKPDARLIIKDHMLDDGETCRLLLDRFARSGADVGRIFLQGSTSREKHLEAFGQIDVCLDPFPHGGGVSTWEALHMGVPVVTKLGKGVTTRAAAAILTAVGLADWIAGDDQDYLAIASRPMQEQLQALRQELPALIERRCGPLAYARAVEEAYQEMWRRYCEAGLPSGCVS
jgi:predicted O-linked N-acetylglucosamine transferase (SPINDLY family)